MKYLIREGHYYANFTIPSLWVRDGHTLFDKDIELGSGCSYKLHQNQGQINKLTGVSFSIFHSPEWWSARFGWSGDGDRILIHAYMHDKNKQWQSIVFDKSEILLGREFRATCMYAGSHYTFRLTDSFGFTEFKHIYSTNEPSKFGYVCKPYFGGEEKAPHDVQILVADH